MLYGSGTIAVIGSPQVKGTWNLTFNPGGEISLSAPNGSYTNFSMPPDAVTLFNGPAYAYFGVQPNQQTSIGQAAVFGHIQISGVSSPIDRNFPNPTLDSGTWEISAEDPLGFAVAAPDALFWLAWTFPDTGYRLQITDDLGVTGWADFSPAKGQIGDFEDPSCDSPTFQPAVLGIISLNSCAVLKASSPARAILKTKHCENTNYWLVDSLHRLQCASGSGDQ